MYYACTIWKQISSGSRSWKVDLMEDDLVGVDLVGVDLVGVDLMGGHLSSKNLLLYISS